MWACYFTFIYYNCLLSFTFLQLNINQGDWLRNSEWDPHKENIILIHGYAGSDNALPMSVLRDSK